MVRSAAPFTCLVIGIEGGMRNCSVYISSAANIDPVKTLMLFVPDRFASNVGEIETFARQSGWIEQTEMDGAVLVAPVSPEGWDECPGDIVRQVYEERRRTFRPIVGDGLPGRKGTLWAWETLIYLIGYEEGARFVGDYLLGHPGFAAASILVNGAGNNLALLNDSSEHWLVKNPSNYDLRNRDIPVALWLLGDSRVANKMFNALLEVDGATDRSSLMIDEVPIERWTNPDMSSRQLWRTSFIPDDLSAIAKIGMNDLFNHVIRWKNGPDGTLATRLSRQDFYESTRYRHHYVDVAGGRYHYAIYLPVDCSESDAAGLPVVISLHGRGEPAWMFAGKNGWEPLADETGAFVVMLPDSPGNIWNFDRDSVALSTMIADALDSYGLDATRVYLTGFSNGAIMTCQMATSYPRLFAAASPWNSPGAAALAVGGLGSFLYADDFANSGFDMPFWTFYGDSDDKAPVVREDGFDAILRANGCSTEPTAHWSGEHYEKTGGYHSGDRLETDVFANSGGQFMAGFTIVRNMPHGAIPDEARACWMFVRRFSRPLGSKHVEVLS